MNGDFNQAGVQYTFTAQAHTPIPILNITSTSYYSLIESKIIEEYIKAVSVDDEQRQQYLRNVDACMVCLDSFLFQCQRLMQHNENFSKSIPEKDSHPTAIFHSGKEIGTDFESLLYQARATLDRLTFFISGQVFHQETDKFKKLTGVLKNFIKRMPELAKAIEVINNSLPHLKGLLIEDDSGKTALRSLLAHSKSHLEVVQGHFSIYRLGDIVIRFDQELQKFPLIISANLLNRYIPYVTLNLLAIFLEIDSELPEKDCQPSWKPCCIHSSKYKVPSFMPSIAFTHPKFSPAGFIPDTFYYSPTILQFAERIDK